MADELQIILKGNCTAIHLSYWAPLADLLEQPPNQVDNSATLKAKGFYKSCMNIRKLGSFICQQYNNMALSTFNLQPCLKVAF